MWRRSKELKGKLQQFTQTAMAGLQLFELGIHYACEHGLIGLDQWVEQVHEKESLCDRLRREIEIDLFEKSLLPETREDLMNLIEWLDRVINAAEEAIRMILVEHISLTGALREDLVHLARMSAEAGELVMELTLDVVYEGSQVAGVNGEIDRLESEVDRLEQHMISELFDRGLPLAEKLHYRDMVQKVAKVSDRAEDVSNWLTVFLAKRRG